MEVRWDDLICQTLSEVVDRYSMLIMACVLNFRSVRCIIIYNGYVKNLTHMRARMIGTEKKGERRKKKCHSWLLVMHDRYTTMYSESLIG